MKYFIYYILAAIGGGIVTEINKPVSDQNMTARHILTVGMTSVIIGVVFGLSVDHFTGSTNLAIACSALAGVGGYSSLQFAGGIFRQKISKMSKKEQ